MKVIIAAAGTGGHINPGLAIANKIMQEEPKSEVLFIGTPRGLENDLVPRAGYKLKTINAYGISRSFTLKNVKRLFKTLHSILEAKKIIKEFQPDLIIGTGGYICISTCIAAQMMHKKYMIHESNVLPGVATKILAKDAEKIMVGFKEAKQRLTEKANVVITGTPTKNKSLNYDIDQIEQKKFEEGFDKDLPLILVFGGSQGAKSINNAMVDIIKKYNEKNVTEKIKYQIIWATGPKQYDLIREELNKEDLNIDNIDRIKVVPYIYNMEEILNISDLIVSRSGAMTITEIEKIGKPAIFIPFPFAAENHQEFNARALEKEGAAKVILDKELTSEKLDEMIKKITNDKKTLQEMGKRSKSLSIDNVEDKIYMEIKEVLKKA